MRLPKWAKAGLVFVADISGKPLVEHGSHGDNGKVLLLAHELHIVEVNHEVARPSGHGRGKQAQGNGNKLEVGPKKKSQMNKLAG